MGDGYIYIIAYYFVAGVIASGTDEDSHADRDAYDHTYADRDAH
jgi:hypothetical protein